MRIAQLLPRMKQPVAHIKLQRGKVAVSPEMSYRIVLLKQRAHVPVLAVAKRQAHVFARVPAAHAVHAGAKPNACGRHQYHKANREAQRPKRWLFKPADAPQKAPAARPKRGQAFKPPKQQHKQAQRRKRRKHANINQLWRVRPQKGEQQRP